MKSIFYSVAMASVLAFAPTAGVSAATQLGAANLGSPVVSTAIARAPLVATSDVPGAVGAASVVNGYDVSGIFSFDGFGDPDNFVAVGILGGLSRVTGIGWDVTIFARPPSWLSEMVIGFGSSSAGFVNLTVGLGDDSPGTVSYSSGGIVDLVGLGLDFTVDADGLLRVEFFESFDDLANDWDGRWESGTVFIQFEPAAVVPEPATWGMMIAGFGLVGFAARRRRNLVAQA